MKLSQQVKPISYLRARTRDVIRGLSRQKAPLVITFRGEPKAILQDIASYEQTQELLALLKILALTNKSIEEGKVRPFRDAFARSESRQTLTGRRHLR
jgi:prevent-host-death family protein